MHRARRAVARNHTPSPRVVDALLRPDRHAILEQLFGPRDEAVAPRDLHFLGAALARRPEVVRVREVLVPARRALGRNHSSGASSPATAGPRAAPRTPRHLGAGRALAGRSGTPWRSSQRAGRRGSNTSRHSIAVGGAWPERLASSPERAPSRTRPRGGRRRRHGGVYAPVGARGRRPARAPRRYETSCAP